MPSTQPNTTYLKLAQNFGHLYDAHSEDNKGQFKAVWAVVTTIPKANRIAEVKKMMKASETIALNSARREYKATVNMCKAYATLPDRTVNLTAVTFENLTRVLKLVTRVVKHYDGDLTKIESIGSIYLPGMSPYRYNNLVEAKCKALNEALPAPTQGSVMTIEQALVQADTMTVEVKTAMLERLMNDLGYSMADVA